MCKRATVNYRENLQHYVKLGIDRNLPQADCNIYLMANRRHEAC